MTWAPENHESTATVHTCCIDMFLSARWGRRRMRGCLSHRKKSPSRGLLRPCVPLHEASRHISVRGGRGTNQIPALRAHAYCMCASAAPRSRQSALQFSPCHLFCSGSSSLTHRSPQSQIRVDRICTSSNAFGPVHNRWHRPARVGYSDTRSPHRRGPQL